MDDVDNRIQYTLPQTAAPALRVDGLPPCTIQAAADGTWCVTAQLAADEQAALAVAVTHPDTLCQRAQHALGLAGIGSRIAPDQGAIGVYAAPLPAPAGAITLVLEGRAAVGSTPWCYSGRFSRKPRPPQLRIRLSTNVSAWK